MRINEILTESEIKQLDEGPIGNAVGAVGRGVGRAVGGVAKGVGAVAGGVAGIGSAMKKGFRAGKATVSGAGDSTPTAAPPATPAATTSSGSTTPPAAQPAATATPAGQSQVKANQTVYSQVKANIDKLDKKGKQRILQLLQKSLATAAPKTAAPANTMSNTPVSASNTAAADNPNQPASASTGNKVFGQMVNQLSQQNASKINSGNALSETLAQRVELHKQKMFETSLTQGNVSIFKK
jgi:pyruvate/2-oxoglutarate dehydrogenase complex dihydrolipoamide acyltransferase (E2) component